MKLVDFINEYCEGAPSREDLECYVTNFFLDRDDVRQEIRLYHDRVRWEWAEQSRHYSNYGGETVDNNCGMIGDEICGYFEDSIKGVGEKVANDLREILTIKLEEEGNE